MNICYIVGAYPNIKCGIGDYTKCIVENIKNKGNIVSVITSKGAKTGENIYNIIDKWNFSSLKVILNKLLELKPDIVHIQYPTHQYGKSFMINLLPYFIKKNIKCKVILTIHEYTTFSKKGRFRISVGANLCDNIIVVENKYINTIKNDKMIKKVDKIKYIPISSNIPKSTIGRDEIYNIRKKYNLEKTNIVLSYFGFIIPLKGFEYLLNSLRKIIDNNYNAKLLCIGELDMKNEYHVSINELINRLNLQNDVIFTGFIDSDVEVANILESTDICILPFKEGVSERNCSFLAACNQNISVITTTDSKKEDLDGIYYCKNCDQDNLDKKIELVIKSNNYRFNRKELKIDECINLHLKLYNEVKSNG